MQKQNKSKFCFIHITRSKAYKVQVVTVVTIQFDFFLEVKNDLSFER